MKIRGSTLTTPISRKAIVKDCDVSGKPWSSQATVDRLCPVFVESGTMVACEPVEGYPLAVTAPEASTITRCGKNLWDLKPSDSNPVGSVNYTGSDGSVVTKIGYCITLPAGTYTFHAELIGEAGGYLYGVVNAADGSYKTKVNLVASDKFYTVTETLSEGDIVYLYNGVGNSTSTTKELFGSRYNVQVEAGSIATDYEPYQGDTFVPGDTIHALPGVNTIWADSGNITVTGRANPAAIIEKLTNAIIAFGGNI